MTPWTIVRVPPGAGEADPGGRHEDSRARAAGIGGAKLVTAVTLLVFGAITTCIALAGAWAYAHEYVAAEQRQVERERAAARAIEPSLRNVT